MLIFEDNFIYTNGGCVLAFGNFDGVHIGHSHLLNCAKKYAESIGLKFGIYTFIDSPKFRDADHSVLSTLQMRLSCFDYHFSPDFVYLESFDSVKDMLPDDFVRYIIKKFSCECAFCGDNFSFGKNAQGDAEMLSTLMSENGKSCVVVEGLKVDGNTVSSTWIKKLIRSGETEKAAELLGYPFSFSSKVIHGAHIGHSLGFPTINQMIPEELVMPQYGVYSTIVIIDGKEYTGVTNFGVKPTVSIYPSCAVAETYIIDFCGDVYDKTVGLSFYKRLRDEKKFSSLEELKETISENVYETMLYFEEKYEKK